MDNPPNTFMEEDAYTEDKIPIKTIYVGDFASEITGKEVKEYFLQFGSVASVAIKRKRSKRAPLIYAFVTFKESRSAAKALALEKHEILSRRVVVKAADGWDQPKEKHAQCKRNKVSRVEASEMEFRLLDLNDDCLYHIASYLKLHDLLNLSKTCKRLECYLEPIFASYKKLDTDSLRDLTLEQIHDILCKIGPHVQDIVCREDFELKGRHFEELVKKYVVAANVVSLDCGNCCLSKGLFKTFKNLETFTCHEMTDDMSAVLTNCSNLQNLDLCNSPDLTGKHLDKLSNLQNLNLLGCDSLQPEFFKNLCMKTKLVSLNIQGCLFLDYSSFATLAITQTQLETLSIDTYHDSNVSPLATLKNLKRLSIDCSYNSCDEFFQELAKPSGAELEVLEISNCQFNQKVEQAICSLKKLKVLVVIDCRNITSMFLTKLAITPLECLAISTSDSILEEAVLNLISKSETIKVIATDNINIQDKIQYNSYLRRLVLSAYEIIKKKERKYPLSLFTMGPCIIDGIYHEKPEFDTEMEFLNQINKLDYLEPLPWWFDLHDFFDL